LLPHSVAGDERIEFPYFTLIRKRKCGARAIFFAERFLHLGESEFISAAFPTAAESLNELDGGLLAGGFPGG